MAGYTDAAFRTLCASFGAGMTVTEMVSAKALVYQDKKTRELLSINQEHRPCAVQIFGSEPEIMAQGARIALELSGADALDINMGCPVGKIVGNGEGSALMKDEKLAARIIMAVKRASNRPVTVKFRSGFNAGERTAVSFARMAEAAGADALCVHGRTRVQMYSGASDREIVGLVKQAVRIPVAASGDAFSASGCREILEQTGADYIMIARGALGAPWIFEDCLRLERGEAPLPLTLERVLDGMCAHMALMLRTKGEQAVRQMRKHLLFYLDRLTGAKSFKVEMSRIETAEEFNRAVERIRAAGPRPKGGGRKDQTGEG